MSIRIRPARAAFLVALLPLILGASAPAPAATWDDLVVLFGAWRDFERPAFVDGVPDYTAAAMEAQRRALPDWQARLGAIDPSGWSVEHQVDWHLVWAEMNGLDFDHRVRKPWARDPAFYVSIYAAQSDVPAHEGPVAHGWIDLWTYEYPLSAAAADELTGRIEAIAPLLAQARGNLTGDARDLWLAGLRSFDGQRADLETLAARVRGTSRRLDGAVAGAIDATTSFRAWLEEQAPTKTGPSGVGKENYTWYMRNVHLVPFSWEEQVAMVRRELAGAHASLRLEEHRNRALPPLERLADAQAYDARLNADVTEYLRFLDEAEIMTVEPWMDPAMRAVNGTFEPVAPGELRNFFNEVNYRDPLVMRTHSHHWIELARLRENPHASPIRRVASLSNIWDARSEGLATGVEEMLMHAGLYDDRPRSRELVWVMLGQRAARALSGLMLHGNEFTMEQAVDNAMTWTPRGWLTEGELVRFEQQLYLRQPGYGTSYLTGKIQIEQLMADVGRRRGDAFTVKGFFDDFFDTGIVPVALARWEMTGLKDPILTGAAR